METIIAFALIWLAANIERIQGKPYSGWELSFLDAALFAGCELIKLVLGTLVVLVVFGLLTKFDFVLWIGELTNWIRSYI